jgi:MoaA/NifB/PqqE/SkfB family radical SAM enzyme
MRDDGLLGLTPNFRRNKKEELERERDFLFEFIRQQEENTSRPNFCLFSQKGLKSICRQASFSFFLSQFLKVIRSPFLLGKIPKQKK